jgi:type 1 fimbria pilin
MRVRTIIATVAATVAALAITALPASAAASVCYDVSVTVNGEAIVDEAGCVEA